eukprot:COSAG01_NODE_1288_length_10887_cov_324.284761_9_plen_320_part_00
MPIAASNEGQYFDPTFVGSSAAMIRLGYIEGFSRYANCIFENPAGLYRTSRISTSLFTTTIMKENKYYNAALSMRLKYGVVGLAFMTLGVEDIGKTGLDNQNKIYETGEFYSYKNSLMKLAYQYSLSDRLHLGANLNFYQLKMDTVSAKGQNLDVGAMYDIGHLEISFMMKNVLQGKRLYFKDTEGLLFKGDLESRNSSDGKTEVFPQSWVLSSRYYLSSFSIMSQLKYFSEPAVFLKHLGVEWRPSFFSFLTFSMGYGEYHNPQSVGTKIDLQHVESLWSAGLGLTLHGVNFDYAYEKGDHVVKSFRDRHYFSVNVYF